VAAVAVTFLGERPTVEMSVGILMAGAGVMVLVFK
jgi:uncharacterized membrane protein